MAALNPLTREVVFKIVFYGPGLGGKTTTLEYIHAATKAEHRGKMVSLATPTDRTLYFDYLPLRVPRVRGMGVRLQLFTVPGQVHFGATRKLVLSGVDGVVFVADSQAGRSEANKESFDDLLHNLAEHQRRLEDVPHTFHWNKRDLSELLSVEELNKRFNEFDAPSITTVATRGEGVFEGLERITRLVLRAYEADMPRSASNEPPALTGDLGLEDAIRSLAESPKDTAAPPSASAELQDGARPAETSPPIPLSRVATPPPTDVPPAPLAPKFKATLSAPPQSEPEPRFSLAEAWPEVDRENVRHAEQLIAAADAGNAVLACDLLLTRVLASAAAFAGSTEAPRDPGLVATLLGVGGAKYLAFRARVRLARQKEPVTMRDAIECFALALEARLARDRLQR